MRSQRSKMTDRMEKKVLRAEREKYDRVPKPLCAEEFMALPKEQQQEYIEQYQQYLKGFYK